MRRVLVIGLDCVPPRLAFERYLSVMPNLARLMAHGSYGALRSSLPPITVPAWACMFSGRDPGELGLYGFRKRSLGSYELQTINSADLSAPMIWDELGERRACVLFVPPSYPPRAINGELVSCFLTPDADAPHTHPPELAAELRARFGPYQPDLEPVEVSPEFLAALYAGSAQRFGIAEYMLRTRRAALTVLVDIGPDRFHHACLAQIDPEHPRHEPGNAYADEGARYYAFLDRQIGRLVDAAGPDCAVLVVSDHGARPLHGGIHINEWLIERGYLTLKHYPDRPRALSPDDVDWSRTRAWGEGGYYARIALNITGREAAGILPPSAAEDLLAELTRELAALPGPHGERLHHRIVRPCDSYRASRGLPPDLLVFFDDLAFRALGSIGSRRLYSEEDDRRADACNHDWDGIFVLFGADLPARGRLFGLGSTSVAATLRELLQVPDAAASIRSA
jgi:predicted AlkP superfamily phosphohydrolase/phosphomutase